MSANPSQLTSENISLVVDIVSTAQAMGLNPVLINAAVNIASAESDLTYLAQNPTSSAWGPFQYLDGSWQTGWNRLVRDQKLVNLDIDPKLVASATRNDPQWQIKVALNEFRLYQDGYPSQIHPSWQSTVDALVSRGYMPDTDFLQYAYLRHNTDGSPGGQVEHIYNTAFTKTKVAQFDNVSQQVQNYLTSGLNKTETLSSIQPLFGLSDSDGVATLFLRSELGEFVSNINYTGSNSAAFLVEKFTIPGVFDLDGGLFLSTGGLPGSSNTSGSFSISNGAAGDTDLTNTAKMAFSGAGTTQDASVLEFNVNRVGDAIDGIAFDIVFGSDEYPEFSNTSFVDVAAIYVNGVNVALFNDNPATPLSVIQQNVTSGNFINNTSAVYATEWDGFSNVLTVRAPLKKGENTIKIGIADTGDMIYDSGLYVNNIEFLTQGATGGGVLNVIDGDDGNNTLLPTIKKEEINLFKGMDTILGTPAQLNGDIITGFGIGDILSFSGVLFGINNINFTFGSAILDIDTDQNSDTDTTVTLEGDFKDLEFNVNQVSGNTEITVSEKTSSSLIMGTITSDYLVGTDNADIIHSLGGSYDRSIGGVGADIFVFGAETLNGIRERDVIMDYEVGIDSIMLTGGASVGSIRETSTGVAIFLDGDFDAIYVQGQSVTPENLTFLPENILI